MKCAGVILAAGASRRMGRPKALLTYRSETFIGRLQRIFLAHCSPVVVVLGHDREFIEPLLDSRATVVTNPEPERGMLSSLQTGLAAVGEAERIMFLPLDYPAVESSTIGSLCAMPECVVGMPRFNGKRGHPVMISRAVAEEILALPHDGAARNVIRSRNAEAAYVDVDDPGILTDVDTPEDYATLTESIAYRG